MQSGEKIKIVQAGATGPVAETFREIIAQPGSPLELEAVAASREEHVGKRLGDIAVGPQIFEDVPVISMDDAVHNTDAPVVFSSLRNDAACEYEDKLAEGRLLATNAGPNRMRSDVALFNAYFNGEQLDELYAEERPGYIMANGNSTSIILSTALAPLHQEFGVYSVNVETLQGWSGKGLDHVPQEFINNEAVLIGGDEKEKIETEPKKFLGSMQDEASMSINATPQRGPWVRGHYEEVRAHLLEQPNAGDIKEIWQSFRSPSCLEDVDLGAYSPAVFPIDVKLNQPKINKGQLDDVHPMRIKARIRRVSQMHGTELKFAISGDNIVLGAAGASVMNIIYAIQKGYVSK